MKGNENYSLPCSLPADSNPHTFKDFVLAQYRCARIRSQKAISLDVCAGMEKHIGFSDVIIWYHRIDLLRMRQNSEFSFRHYVWIRRFENEAERKQLYKEIYESDFWVNEIKPQSGEMLDRESIINTLLEATPKSVLR